MLSSDVSGIPFVSDFDFAKMLKIVSLTTVGVCVLKNVFYMSASSRNWPMPNIGRSSNLPKSRQNSEHWSHVSNFRHIPIRSNLGDLGYLAPQAKKNQVLESHFSSAHATGQHWSHNHRPVFF